MNPEYKQLFIINQYRIYAYTYDDAYKVYLKIISG